MASLKPLLAFGLLVLLAGCASIGPPQPPSLQLPTLPSDLRATRKGDKVALAWTPPAQTTDRQTLRGLGPTHICRGLDAVLKGCGVPVGQVISSPSSTKSTAQRIQATYTDTLSEQLEHDHPEEFITYAVEVLNSNGHSAGLSNQVRVSRAPTLPPPREFTAQVTAQGVVLTWLADSSPTPHSRIHYVYRVYRRSEGSQQGILIAELPLGNQSDTTFTDPTIEWEQTYYYHINVTTVVTPEGKSEVRIEGDDSPQMKVFVHDVFPPAVPSGLQAVYSGPGQQLFIDLTWAPVTDVDLAGYHVYRHEPGAPPVKINQDLIKTPAYRDADVEAGKTYFYSVSAVDVRGNESARSDEASESVP